MVKRSSIPPNNSDSSSPSECEDSNFDPTVHRKARTRACKNFEKNYPKNILISILTALDKIGEKRICQDSKIEESVIQQRNSASLDDLYKILFHKWMKNINKTCIEILASNILLQNSKISKKAFHLKVLRDVFSFNQDVQLAQFKNQMKKKASKNCVANVKGLSIFKHQSSTIFLLKKFSKYIEKDPDSIDSQESTQDSGQQSKKISKHEDLIEKSNKKNNRQLLKPLICELCLKLNKMDLCRNRLEQVENSMCKLILKTKRLMREKLNISKGIFRIKNNFMTNIVKRCFKLLKEKRKINFTELSKYVKEFDEKSLLDVIKPPQPQKKSFKQFQESDNNSEKMISQPQEHEDTKSWKKLPVVILVQSAYRIDGIDS